MFPDLSRLDIFITAFCVWISRDAGTIHHSGAGHPAGILRPKMGAISTLQSRGLPLGVLKDAIYETRKMDFERESSLVLFSDGISETRDQSGNFFGDEGILAVVESNPDLSAEFLVKGIVDAVDQFSGNAPLVDDRSILAVLRKA
jgi:sigma-B regulation protein RsbU (phosphoserine phosphatase)